jgi:hypothetical protein
MWEAPRIEVFRRASGATGMAGFYGAREGRATVSIVAPDVAPAKSSVSIPAHISHKSL